MSLQERLTEDVKTAMKAREAGKSRLSVLRMVKASIRNIEIDRKKELNDEDVLDVLAKEVKMRRDSMDDFRKGNRPDLVAALEEEIAISVRFSGIESADLPGDLPLCSVVPCILWIVGFSLVSKYL